MDADVADAIGPRISEGADCRKIFWNRASSRCRSANLIIGGVLKRTRIEFIRGGSPGSSRPTWIRPTDTITILERSPMHYLDRANVPPIRFKRDLRRYVEMSPKRVIEVRSAILKFQVPPGGHSRRKGRAEQLGY